MFKYIFDNISYSELSACNGVEGRMIVRFKVDLEGNIKDIELPIGLDELINEKVLSVIRSVPKLTDCEMKQFRVGNQKYYVGTFILPIRFKII